MYFPSVQSPESPRIATFHQHTYVTVSSPLFYSNNKGKRCGHLSLILIRITFSPEPRVSGRFIQNDTDGDAVKETNEKVKWFQLQSATMILEYLNGVVTVDFFIDIFLPLYFLVGMTPSGFEATDLVSGAWTQNSLWWYVKSSGNFLY